MRGWLRAFTTRSFEFLINEILKYQETTNDRDLRLVFTGGEPLTVPAETWRSFITIINRYFPSHKFHLKLAMQSNLFDLSTKMLRLIKRNNIGIGCSYDFVEQTRLDNCGRPSSERVFNNMRRARKAGIPLGLICVVSKHNLSLMEDIYDYAIENNFSFHFNPINKAPYKHQRKLLVDPTEYAHNLYIVLEKHILSGFPGAGFSIADSYASIILRDSTYRPKCSFFAKCCENFVAINADGDVFPCPEFELPGFKLGNIHKMPMAEILSPSNPIKKAFTYRLKHRFRLNPQCKRCELSPVCFGGCPYESYEAGNYLLCSPFTCQINMILLPKLITLFNSIGMKTVL